MMHPINARLSTGNVSTRSRGIAELVDSFLINGASSCFGCKCRQRNPILFEVGGTFGTSVAARLFHTSRNDEDPEVRRQVGTPQEGGHTMTEQERREFRRLSLRLPVVGTEGGWRVPSSQRLWTRNISAGGMYMYVPPEHTPEQGVQVSFELNIPPGQGHSSSSGTVRGTGKVLRTEQVGQTRSGVAVQFTHPLMLDFQ